MRAVVLRRHHQPGGVLIEPVHNAGPADAADPGKARAAMGDQRVDQGPALVARGRVHHKVSRLVDDDDVVVLVDDIERYILRHGLGGCYFRHVDYDRIARPDMISGVADGGTSDADGARENQRLQPRPRKFRHVACEHAVEPHRSLVAGDGDFQPRAIRRRALFQR